MTEMTKSGSFVPYHINATAADLKGNNGIGRYILLPGSDGRAKGIAEQFDNLVVKSHPRCYNLYLGTVAHEGKTIDVATISSGIGCPSMEIILHELFHLGAKRFLRVGTAGSLQAKTVKVTHLINAQAAVRDERTTTDYAPIEIPALASPEMMSAILQSAKTLGLADKVHTGAVHCKSSFYAREFGAGPESVRNLAYMDLLTECGVMATEMETAALFMQAQIYNHQLMQIGRGPQHRVLCGAILAILGIPPHQFATPAEEKQVVNDLISLGFQTIKQLAVSEL